MTKILPIIASIGLILLGYGIGVSQSPEPKEIEVIKEIPVEKIVEIEKPIEVVKTVPVEKIKTVTVKEACSTDNPQLKAFEDYVRATINSYPADEAVDRLTDTLNPPDWK